MTDRRIAITGIGILGPCGEGKDALWQAAIERTSAISPRGEGDLPGFDIPAAGFVRGFMPAKYIKQRKSIKVMCRDIQMAVAASHLARQDAGFSEVNNLDPHRSGVCIGAGIFEQDPSEMSDSFRPAVADDKTFDSKRFGAEGLGQLFPLWLLKYLPNMPACHITIDHNLQGPSNTLTADSSGSASAIEEAVRVIQRGIADVMFCGGAESRLYGEGLLRYSSEGILKKTKDATSEYPVFTENASGLVMGEGGTILILETLESAQKRQARVYAELKGFGTTSDGVVRTTEDRAKNLARTMTQALNNAGVKPEDVNVIHLSARGILREDSAEAEAVKLVFGGLKNKPVLAATKALTGFLGYAAAPTELALASIGISNQSFSPSLVQGSPLLSGGFKFSGDENVGGAHRIALVNHFEEGLTNHSFVLAKESE